MKTATISDVRQAVADVRDPEIPSLTILDLGILRDVRIEDGVVVVSITPTYSGCPAMGVIEEDVIQALRRFDVDARVETVLTPAWTTDWMTDEAKAKLAQEGVGAPGSWECPNCRSTDIRLASQFGSTACMALNVCNTCSEPFPYFKTHR